MPKRKEGKPPATEAAKAAETAKTARRRARVRLGSPPPEQIILPKSAKPPKHKKPPGLEDAW